MRTVNGTIDAVLLDFGGVIGVSPMTFMIRLAEYSGTTADVIIDAVFGAHTDDPDNPWHAVERGELVLDSEEFAATMGRRFAERGASYDHTHFVGWVGGSDVTPQAIMTDLAWELRRAGVPLGLLTNSVPEFRATIERTVPLAELFDAVIDSCEVGLRKPDPRIYLLAAERLGAPPERCLFVDDFAANVAGAAAVGMTALHLTDATVTAAQIRALLNP